MPVSELEALPIGSRLASRDLDERFTSFERGDDLREVGFNAAQQFHPSTVADPNPDNSRSFLQNPANGEVFILRDDDGTRLRGVGADRIVGGRREPAIRKCSAE